MYIYIFGTLYVESKKSILDLLCTLSLKFLKHER